MSSVDVVRSFDVVRIYADDRGESHFEDIVLEGEERHSPTGVVARVSELGADGLVLRDVLEEASDVDPHVAPRRLVIVHLEGEVEVEASDGEVRRFGPGDVVLVEDLTGKGHITRKLGAGRRRTLVGLLR